MPAKKGFSKKQKEEILKQATAFWDSSTEAMGPLFKSVNELERMARCQLPEELENVLATYPDRSALVPPTIYNNLNSLRAYHRTALFKKKPYMRLSHVGQAGLRDDRIEKAEQQLQAIMDMEAEGRGFVAEADKAVYQALYAGITIVFTQWTRRWERRVQRRENDLGVIVDDNGAPVFKMEMVSEYPETISLDIRRARIDPGAAERKDIRIVGYHSLSQLSDLLALMNNPNTHYDFLEKELRASSFDRGKYFEFDKSDSETYGDKTKENTDFGDKIVEARSIRGLFRIGKNEVRDLIVEIGNATVLLAVKENDLPISGWELFDFPAVDEQHGRLYTMGVVEPARDTFIEQFLKKNQALDSANRNVHTTFVGDTGACQNLPDLLESSDDRILKIDLAASGLPSVAAALQPLERPELGQDTFLHSQVLEREVQQTMRRSDYSLGNNPKSTETATAVVEVVAGGQGLTDHLLEKLADTYYRPVSIKKLILWNFFNAHKEHVVHRSDGTALNIKPGEINLPFHVWIDTNIAATHPAAVRRFVEMFPVIANDPWFDPLVVRETAVDMLDLPNKDRLLPPPDYVRGDIEREHIALLAGLEQPVLELDNHNLHVQLHMEHAEFLAQLPPEELGPMQVDNLEAHIQEHLRYIEKQNEALGNTKAGGGNTGTLSQPDGARMKTSSGGQTGRFTPSESRK